MSKLNSLYLSYPRTYLHLLASHLAYLLSCMSRKVQELVARF